MKKEILPYFQKWIIIAVVLVVVSMVYSIFKLDLYVWSCDSEGNTGSCLLASRLYQEADNHSMTEKYLRKSCDGSYALGCFELGNFLKQNGQTAQGQKAIDLACELDHKPACPN